jgi:hypothetical protein
MGKRRMGNLAMNANCERAVGERRKRINGKLSREGLVTHSEAQRLKGERRKGVTQVQRGEEWML